MGLTKNLGWLSKYITADSSGQIGVNTTTPQSQFSIGTNHGALISIGAPSWLSKNVLVTSYDTSDFTQLLVAGGATNSANITLRASGNVGIGSVNPKTILQASSNGAGSLPSLGDIGAATSLYLTNNNFGYGMLAGSLPTGNSWIQSQRTDAIATFYNLLLQPNGGNIGIGTVTPTDQLHISKGGSTYIAIDNTGSNYKTLIGTTGSGTKIYSRVLSTNAAAPIAFVQGADENVTITASGNLLVGTQTDNGNRLNVNGSIKSNIIDSPQYITVDSSGTSFISYYNGLPERSSKSFLIYNSPDSPITGGMWTVYMIKWSNSYGSMTAINCEPNTQTMYVKTVYGGIWSGWVQK